MRILAVGAALLALHVNGCQKPAVDIEEAGRKPVQPARPMQDVVSIPTTDAPSGPQVAPRFVDVAATSGIDFSYFPDIVADRYFLPEIMGGGAAWLDYDSDGILDVYLTNGCRLEDASQGSPDKTDQLFRGLRDGQFRPLPAAAGISDPYYGQGAAAGDFNADGFPDVFVSNFGPKSLLENCGDGTFENVTQSAGVDDPRWSSSCVWADLNADQLLDLYVVNYLDVTLANRKLCEYDAKVGYCGPGQYSSVPDQVFLSNGNGSFREAAAELGMQDQVGKGLAIVVADFNNDQMPEIYVGNDMTPNFLFVREPGDGVHYSEVAAASGCAQDSGGMNEASMGIACADFDNDGLNDLYLTHYYHMKNTLYRNCGHLLFDDVSRLVGTVKASYDRLGFGVNAIDFDRDGFDDLLVATGHVLGPNVQPNEMRPQLIWNQKGKKFTDIGDQAGEFFLKPQLARGAAAADLDDDGDLDSLMTYLDRPVALLRNETKAGGSYVGIDLRLANRIPPVGARVTVFSGERQLTKTMTLGGSYLCTNDSRLLFPGEKDSQGAVVEVVWPSGKRDRFEGLALDAYWALTEGGEARRAVR